MKKKEVIFQEHHISYLPEIKVKVTRAEHFYLTRLNYFKEFTVGFRKAVKAILREKPIKTYDNT